jgi:hypothetical protein
MAADQWVDTIPVQAMYVLPYVQCSASKKHPTQPRRIFEN